MFIFPNILFNYTNLHSHESTLCKTVQYQFIYVYRKIIVINIIKSRLSLIPLNIQNISSEIT